MKLDRDSMCGGLTLTNKPDYKAFKFSDNSQVLGALKTDTKSNLAVHRQKGNALTKKLPQGNDLTAWRDTSQGTAYVTSSCEPERRKERKRHYNQKTLMDSETPELVSFFEEHDYQFVKDIFMYKEVPSLNKCLEQNCKLDHKNISYMLISDVDDNSESIKRNLETMSFVSDELKNRVENDSGKDVIKKCDSENLMVRDEDDSDAGDGRVVDCSSEKNVPGRQLFGKVDNRESDSSNSMVPSATEVTEDNSHTSEASSESELESGSIIHHSDSSVTTINSEEELQQDTDSEQLLENQNTSKPQDEMSQSLTGSSQSFVHQYDEGESNSFPIGALSGPIPCSEQVPYSGSISFRSNSSSHSFAFPVLASEWNGSPVRMAKADRRQLRKQQRWRMCLLCYKF